MGEHWDRVVTSGAVAAPNPRCAEPPPEGLLEGIRLFNAGEYYACHHALEANWMAERDPIRYVYQAVLQIGVGFYHLGRGNWRGATLLLHDGIDKLQYFQPVCMQIDTARLAAEASVCLVELHTLGSEQVAAFDRSLIPQVHLLASGGIAGDCPAPGPGVHCRSATPTDTRQSDAGAAVAPDRSN